MNDVPALRFSHVGLYVADLTNMEVFYSSRLGLVVTDRGRLDTPRGAVDLVFLSRDPDEHHQIVLASGRPRGVDVEVINQISFRTTSLADLRRIYLRLVDDPQVTEVASVSHGNAISVYFRDPERNRIEIFVDTPWYATQPVREPIDLMLSDEALMGELEARVRRLPGFRRREEWRAELMRRLGMG